MRHLVFIALLALPVLGAGPALAQTSVGERAMTSLLMVCLPHAAGEPVDTLVRRAQSGGFQRDLDRGGALGEVLTWREGQARIMIELRRAETLQPQTCRIQVDHGGVDAAALAKEFQDWALATRPAYEVVDIPPDPFAWNFGPKAVGRTVFQRPGERLIVERFDRPTEGFQATFQNQAVIVTLEAR